MDTETITHRLDTTVTELVPQAQCRHCDLPEVGFWSDVDAMARAHVRETGHTVIVTAAIATVHRPHRPMDTIRR